MKKILIAFLLVCAALCAGQTAVTLATPPKLQFFLPDGTPNAFGCVFFYQTGTTNPQDTYTDFTGITKNQNPVVLDSGGFANVWLQSGLLYSVKVVANGGVNCISGQTQYTVSGINQTLLNLSNIWQQAQTFNSPITLLPSDLQ